MSDTTIPPSLVLVVGRDALARILTAVDAGAPCPDTVACLDRGADISYYRDHRTDPAGDAAAMARALGIGGKPTTYQFDGYRSLSWDGYRSLSWTAGGRWAVHAFVTDAPAPEPIDDPVALAAAYGLAVDPGWLRPEEHPDGTYGQPPAQSTVDTMTPLDLTAIDQALAEAQETP